MRFRITMVYYSEAFPRRFEIKKTTLDWKRHWPNDEEIYSNVKFATESKQNI